MSKNGKNLINTYLNFVKILIFFTIFNRFKTLILLPKEVKYFLDFKTLNIRVKS